MKTAQRSLILCAAALVLLPVLARAEDWRVSVDLDFNSAHIWRGITFNDEEVLQPSITVASPMGLSINAWANYDVDDYSSTIREDDFSEIDYTVSYHLPFEPIDVQLALIKYTYHRRDEVSETREAMIRAAVEVLALDVIAEAYYDFDVIEDYYLNVGLEKFHELTELFELQLSSYAGYAGNDFAQGHKSGWHDYSLSAALNFASRDHVTAGGWLSYTDTLHRDVLPEQDVDLYYGFHVGYHF